LALRPRRKSTQPRSAKPSESKYAWDYFKVIEVVPGVQVTRPLAEGDCPLVAKK
jgi:branched-chain amino acid transport system substrate-binding protein